MAQPHKSDKDSMLVSEGSYRRFVRALEIDTRMIGMLAALVLIWISFDLYGAFFLGRESILLGGTGVGNFLSARNIFTLSLQAASISVMATGMVLIIVTRNIDLSVGSLLGFTGMVMGVLQVDVLPNILGGGSPAIWVVTLLCGIAVGALIGALNGYLVAYQELPSFIVTLGGLLVWRGAAWWVARGETVAPMDPTFRIIGGQPPAGTIGATWTWVVAAIVVAAIVVAALVFALYNQRQQRKRFEFPLRPIWADTLLGLVGAALAFGAAALFNSYPLPEKLAAAYAEKNGIPIPQDGVLFISHGFPVPLLVALFVAFGMNFLAKRTGFGRYVFSIGGNPEAANLAGINTRAVIVMLFALMGSLAAISAAISTARLNAATNALGVSDELFTIAAAVVGGTSLAGGSGTVYGALLGALVMQSLQSGMVLIGVDSALQQIVVGLVLVLAIWIDHRYRKASKQGA